MVFQVIKTSRLSKPLTCRGAFEKRADLKAAQESEYL
jgi:hypothetical protein